MNLSGEAVMRLVNYSKIDPEDLLVVYDDIDLAPGYIRIRRTALPGAAGAPSIGICG